MPDADKDTKPQGTPPQRKAWLQNFRAQLRTLYQLPLSMQLGLAALGGAVGAILLAALVSTLLRAMLPGTASLDSATVAVSAPKAQDTPTTSPASSQPSEPAQSDSAPIVEAEVIEEMDGAVVAAGADIDQEPLSKDERRLQEKYRREAQIMAEQRLLEDRKRALEREIQDKKIEEERWREDQRITDERYEAEKLRRAERKAEEKRLREEREHEEEQRLVEMQD